MSPETSHLAAVRRWLVPVVALLALTHTATAAAAGWQIEPIGASEGVHELHDLAFDGHGRALLSWDAALQGHVPPTFAGLATRDPAGGWQRPPDLAGVDPASAQVHVFSGQQALLVGRQGGAGGSADRGVVVADGQTDGGFGPLRVLSKFTASFWSASDASGDAIVAWKGERSPFLTVSERTAGHAFSRPRDLAIGRSATVAMDDRGDRVLAWPDGRRISARVRRRGGAWGPIEHFGHLPADRDRRLSSVVAPGGRVVVTWGRDGGDCGVAVRDAHRVWRTRRLEAHCASASVGDRDAPVIPVADATGATYVAWTHRTPKANSVTLARVGADGPVGRIVVSRQRGAILDDVATGPGAALAITWSAVLSQTGAPLRTATYAAVRRAGAGFQIDRLSPGGVLVDRGSRVAFQPLTGQAVVAIPYRVGRTLAVGAVVGAPPSP
ncbi:MAG TPA: hypothetical protein VHZ31_09580 [Solirubrobacteraceae bacterium]|nr:hypothetical protein [Solirubrobacteraceae bacterium]